MVTKKQLLQKRTALLNNKLVVQNILAMVNLEPVETFEHVKELERIDAKLEIIDELLDSIFMKEI